MSVLEIKDFETLCMGCSTCANVCTKNAIEMQLDEEGFYRPSIISEKCINCGLCTKTCQITMRPQVNVMPIAVYSGYAKDTTMRAKGSSGGIFGLLAQKVLYAGGVVYGAIFDKEKQEVVCTSTNEVPLEKLLRSKYVQSAIGFNYRKIKKQLQTGRQVLFSGTPCQVCGLKRYLNREYHNLLCVDFLCHGVPSVRFFKDMLQEESGATGSLIVDVRFREKMFGWRNQAMVYEFENGEKKVYVSLKSPYYTAFLYSYSIGKQCYNCSFTCVHESDLTLADYWAVPKEKDTDEGYSLIAINTNSGFQSINNLQEVELCKENKVTWESVAYPHKNDLYDIRRRKAFFKFYCKHGYHKTVTDFMPKRYEKLIRNLELKKIVRQKVGKILKILRIRKQKV